MFPLRHTFARRGFQQSGKILLLPGLFDRLRTSDGKRAGRFLPVWQGGGVRAKAVPKEEEFGYLDDPVLRRRLVDFADERVTRVTFRVPSVHCIACVWLLENLFRLKPGIGYSRVNFPRKEVYITFENAERQVERSGGVADVARLHAGIQLVRLGRASAPSGVAAALAATGGGWVRFRQHHVVEHFLLSGAGRFQRAGIAEDCSAGSAWRWRCRRWFTARRDYWRAAWLAVRRRDIHH